MTQRLRGPSPLSAQEESRARWTRRREELCLEALADRPKVSRDPSERFVRPEAVFNAARRDAPQVRCF